MDNPVRFQMKFSLKCLLYLPAFIEQSICLNLALWLLYTHSVTTIGMLIQHINIATIFLIFTVTHFREKGVEAKSDKDVPKAAAY